MKNLVPLLLLLGGCATPMEELYEQRNVCIEQGQNCLDLHVEINEREIRREQREYNHVVRCPRYTVEFCSGMMRGCGDRNKAPDDEYLCITQGQLSDLLRY